MNEKIKEFLKKYLIGFIIGVITTFSISVIAATYFPSKDVTYDNKESGLESQNIQGAIDEIYGICTTPSTAGDWVLKKEPIVDSGDGLYKDEYEEGKYTYKGANPNNYVTFNDEKAGWRIISINSDGKIKIMKIASIRNRIWDGSNSNNWNRPADINTYLNGYYYNSLTSTSQSQIVEETYYVGTVTSGNDIQDQISEEKAVTSKIKVALPTLSEYLRSNSNTSNCRTVALVNQNYNTCKNTTWMFNSDNWWTMSASAHSTGAVFDVNSYGSIDDNYSVIGSIFGTRPTLYLNSNIKLSGSGTESDPYVIE